MTSLPRVTLVLGGARSGKSRYAEALVLGAAPRALYVATATAGDDEMAARIQHHQAGRDGRWDLIEEPIALARLLDHAADGGPPILIDCLTLWLTNIMMSGDPIEPAMSTLVDAIGRTSGPVVLVANEVGLGIVPDNDLARIFRDHAGRLNQSIAALADRVVFVAAGLPLVLKEC